MRLTGISPRDGVGPIEGCGGSDPCVGGSEAVGSWKARHGDGGCLGWPTTLACLVRTRRGKGSRVAKAEVVVGRRKGRVVRRQVVFREGRR